VTPKVYENLLKICVNEDWNADRQDGGGVNILISPVAAHDIKVSYKKPGEKGNKTTMTLTDIEERKKTSILHKDEKERNRICGAVPNIDDVVPRKTSKEVDKLFMDFVNAGLSEDKASEKAGPDIEYGKKSEAKSNNAEKLTGTKSLDDAFEDLMNS
jgi:hypothetical protein